MIEENDTRKRRCPMLGHEISFSYCRCPGQETPCRRIFDCWWESFDVGAFMTAHFSADQIAQIRKPPPPKAASLFSILEQVRGRIEGQSPDSH